jgi:hypothetical protein
VPVWMFDDPFRLRLRRVPMRPLRVAEDTDEMLDMDEEARKLTFENNLRSRKG